MSVDLSKAKKGDKVRFRCGGGATIREVAAYTDEDGVGVILEWEGFINGNWNFGGDGLWCHGGRNPSPFDIVEITAAPFDWKDAQPGMAFRSKEGDHLLWFVGRSLIRPKTVFLMNENDAVYGFRYPEAILARDPEHDIEVAP